MFYAFQGPDRPFVVNRAKNPSTCPTHRPHVEAFSSDSPGNGVIELAGGEEGKDNIVNVSICKISVYRLSESL